MLPWREDIHLVPRVSGLDLDAITAYLNSEQVQDYMYKAITPHLTITQLRQLPVKNSINKSENCPQEQQKLNIATF